MTKDRTATTLLLRTVMLLCGLALLGSEARAQPTQAGAADSSVVLRLRDGSTVTGRLVRSTADSLEVVTSSGRLMLARSAITASKTVSDGDLHDGVYWAPDPHYSRLFFGPTGRTLDAGDGYFSDFELLFLNVGYGITERFTLGGGLSVFPTGDFSNNIYYLTPKIGLLRGERFNVSAGALIGFAGREYGSAGLLYLAATSGSRNSSLTYGVGWAYANDKVDGDATLMLGGTLRLSRRVALMSENYLFTGRGGGYALPMYGLRFVGDNLSADLGFVNFLGRDTEPFFPGVPWIGFAVKF